MRVRLLRGQIVIREIPMRESVIWTPDPRERDRRIHRGRVLAHGPPRLMGGVEIPHGFGVDDEVLYTFDHNKEAFTLSWLDGQPAVWIPASNIQAVLVRESVLN